MYEVVLPHYDVHDGDGPALLLVHGLLSSRAHWTPNLARLKQVCTPVVVELYGHGRSPAPAAREGYRPDAYVRAFEAIRERLGTSRWLLLGQSLGAALTLRYALEHPGRVIGQLLTNSMSAFADASWTERMRADMTRFEASVAKHGAAALERLAVHPRHARNLDPELKALLVADAALADPPAIALAGAETSANASVLARLHENRVPALLLHGTRERRFAPMVERAREHMPQLTVVPLDAGHAVNLDAPEAFDQAASEFIRRLRRGG